jgi:chromosome segregation ATPase
MADADGLLRLLSDHTAALATLHAELGSPPETLSKQLASLQTSLVATIDDQRRSLEKDVARLRDTISTLRNEVTHMQHALGEPELDTDQHDGESLIGWKERVKNISDTVRRAHKERSCDLRVIIDTLRGFVDILGSDWQGLRSLPNPGEEDVDLRLQKLEEWQGAVVACESEIVSSVCFFTVECVPVCELCQNPGTSTNNSACSSHRDPPALVRAWNLAVFCLYSSFNLFRRPSPSCACL